MALPLTRTAFFGFALALGSAGAEPAAVEFNRDIRPILSDRCFACHGPDASQRKTKLRFDIEAGAQTAIVPRDPSKSEIYKRIRSDNKAMRMPPAYAGHDRLPDRDIELIRRWIEQGAVWQDHWSFITPKRPTVPESEKSNWARGPIDGFVLARLAREGLKPQPETDRTTLIRRVTLDLTGLPPTPAEVDAFLEDASALAYEKVVDRLLASPRYGERMAVPWLDAARYADTNGYQSDGERSMWRWRDWVIDAFSRNLPFDRFTIEQIAGDLLPHATPQQRIASGFHRNHRTNAEGGIVEEEFRVEYVADRVETTSTVWLGLTMGCARCHDHKYDPIKQRDFYRVFAYFNNVPERGLVYNFGNDEPFMKAPLPDQERKLAQLDANVAEAEHGYASLRPVIAKAQRKWEKSARRGAKIEWLEPEGQSLRFKLDDTAFDGQRAESRGDVANFNYQDAFSLAAWIRPDSPNGAIVSRMEDYYEGEGYGLFLLDGRIRLHIIRRFTDIGLRLETEQAVAMNRWQHVLVTYDGRRKGAGVRIYLDGEPRKLNVLFDELTYPYGPKEPFRIGAGGGPKLRFRGAIDDVRVFKTALTAQQAHAVALQERVDEIAAIDPAARTAAQADKLALYFLEAAAPKNIREARRKLTEARKERTRFYDSIQTVMVMTEGPERDAFVLRRGAYDARAEKVTPGVPAFLPQPQPQNAPQDRLSLARWLVDPVNPLTARVAVNRYWQMYFGTGLVKTSEDFGSQGEWPVYQELLDWLAVEFMESGWDVKRMQKTIVTSATYRQSSKATPELLQRDPENRLLARGARFRLPAEMIRDQALALAGLLVEKTGGPSVKPYQPPGLWQELAGGKGYTADHGEGLYRRSLYTYWKRTVAPPSMVTFDAPARETCAVRGTRTNTPLQALNLMNDVAYVEAARKLAERMLTASTPGRRRTREGRIAYAFRLAVARPPSPGEVRVLSEALAKFEDFYKRDPKAAAQFLTQGESPRGASLEAHELAAYTGVASLLLNLDETITRE